MRPFILAIFLLCGSPLGTSAADLDTFLADHPSFSGIIVTGNMEGVTGTAVQGLADAAQDRAIAPDDIWRWASVTKQLIAVLVMQEVEAGRLALSDTLKDRLPEFDVSGASRVTIKDLLRHTSGLGEPQSLPDLDAAGSVDGVAHCAVRMRSRPARRFVYNNCDTVLLGAILERVTDTPWAELLDTRIFTPLGMTRAGVMTGARPTTVKGYQRAGTPEPPIHPAAYGAAGAAYGPAQDLIAFNAGLLTNRLMSEETRAIMWTGEPKFGYVALGVWSFPAPLAGCDGPVRLIERRGFIGGVQARNIIAPDMGKSLVVLTNHGDFSFGEIWTGQGFSHALLSRVLCRT